MTPEPEYRIALSVISCTILSLFERFISLACRKKFPITFNFLFTSKYPILPLSPNRSLDKYSATCREDCIL